MVHPIINGVSDKLKYNREALFPLNQYKKYCQVYNILEPCLET